MKRALLFLALFSFTLAGCTDGDLLVSNQNPNATTDPSFSGLLSSSIQTTSSSVIPGAASATSYYTQHLASPSGSALDQHYEARFGGTWSSVYDVLADTDALIEKAEAENSPYYAGIARVIKAYNMGLATDLWGSIPYEQALQGRQGEVTPSYDDQQAIYTAIQSILDTAIQNLNAESSTFEPGGDDFIHGGDLAKWRKTAWALKARYLNHLSKKSSYSPTDVLSAVDNAMTANEDDAQMDYANDPANNPWHNVFLEQEGGILGGHLSEQLVKEMDGTLYGPLDPRLQTAITDSTNTEGPSPTPAFAGNRNGQGAGDYYNHLEGDRYYASEDAPILWITYAEVKFIEAEAALRDNQPSRAYSAYMEGIRAHMDKVGVSTSKRDAYMNDPAVDVGQSNLTLDHIFKEKNVALFLNPEAWVDHRRHDYDYPDFEPPANQNPLFNGSSADHIRRALYPLSELERNGSNVPEVELDQLLWWDQS